jgi:ubiquitin carboxyl-terminal hydrolase L5
LSRKLDILNIDAVLEEEFEEQKTRMSNKKSKTSHNDNAAFHFVTYLPIGDEIWRLDGLDAFPQKFGECVFTPWERC